ncbi:MAG: 2-C-methyl-D-erythritol 4-phosphate cytidylyltransferase [Candidatus Cloacimonetes bacterium]|nr:2-C-methyl-D-erythritol 4-phosphate cytidylyltransferase [Candidatus Cloacimonadota bacterium]
MPDQSVITAIITAGGLGTRLVSETPKQFLLLKGRPLLYWAIDKFYNSREISNIIITLPARMIAAWNNEIRRDFPDKEIIIISGGRERQDSVFKALLKCPPDCDYVVIHDGVRPFIRDQEISAICHLVRKKKAVIAAAEVTDTIKEVESSLIVRTIPRERLYRAQTPQAFDFKLIMNCHQKARTNELSFTDDAALLEHYGYPVHIFPAGSHNFKITTVTDLLLAETLLAQNTAE